MDEFASELGEGMGASYQWAVHHFVVHPLSPDPPVACVTSGTRWVSWEEADAKAGWTPGERWRRRQLAQMGSRSSDESVDQG